MPKIKYIDYGIASRIGNTIYLNKDLKKNKKLHRNLLIHEKKHTNSYLWKDLNMDLNNKELKGLRMDYYKFLFSNPKAWIQYMPIWTYDKKTTWDITLIIFYLILIITIIILLYALL